MAKLNLHHMIIRYHICQNHTIHIYIYRYIYTYTHLYASTWHLFMGGFYRSLVSQPALGTSCLRPRLYAMDLWRALGVVEVLVEMKDKAVFCGGPEAMAPWARNVIWLIWCLGKCFDDQTLISRAPGIMVYFREIIPKWNVREYDVYDVMLLMISDMFWALALVGGFARKMHLEVKLGPLLGCTGPTNRSWNCSIWLWLKMINPQNGWFSY